MNARELTAELSVSRRTLTKWLAAGLPYTRTKRGRQFDGAVVIEWLVKQGLATKPPHVVPTAAAAAKELGISERAFHTWLAAGCPARVPSGGYDVDIARQWNLDRRRQPDPLLSGTVSPMLERYRAERWRLARLERKERERELLPRPMVAAWITEVFRGLRACHTTLLRQFGPEAVEIVKSGLLDAADGFAQQWGNWCRGNGLALDLTRLEENYSPQPREETENASEEETAAAVSARA